MNVASSLLSLHLNDDRLREWRVQFYIIVVRTCIVPLRSPCVPAIFLYYINRNRWVIKHPVVRANKGVLESTTTTERNCLETIFSVAKRGLGYCE